jgi:hypothetical protein
MSPTHESKHDFLLTARPLRVRIPHRAMVQNSPWHAAGYSPHDLRRRSGPPEARCGRVKQGYQVDYSGDSLGKERRPVYG